MIEEFAEHGEMWSRRVLVSPRIERITVCRVSIILGLQSGR